MIVAKTNFPHFSVHFFCFLSAFNKISAFDRFLIKKKKPNSIANAFCAHCAIKQSNESSHIFQLTNLHVNHFNVLDFVLILNCCSLTFIHTSNLRKHRIYWQCSKKLELEIHLAWQNHPNIRHKIKHLLTHTKFELIQIELEFSQIGNYERYFHISISLCLNQIF